MKHESIAKFWESIFKDVLESPNAKWLAGLKHYSCEDCGKTSLWPVCGDCDDKRVPNEIL